MTLFACNFGCFNRSFFHSVIRSFAHSLIHNENGNNGIKSKVFDERFIAFRGNLILFLAKKKKEKCCVQNSKESKKTIVDSR